MRITRTMVLATAVVMMAAPAGGTAEPQPPLIVDPAGDANGLFVLGEEGPDTRPASDDRSDILRIWLETTYETVSERAPDGSILAVHHLPEALRISVRTGAPAKPATGPTLLFQLAVDANGCWIGFQFYVHGLAGAGDPPEVAEIDDAPPDGVSVGGGCIGTEIRSPSFVLAFDGDVARMEFPFDALVGTRAEELVAPGVALGPGGQPPAFTRVRQLETGGLLHYGWNDRTRPLPGFFVIGSDVPADVDCTATPDHPACRV